MPTPAAANTAFFVHQSPPDLSVLSISELVSFVLDEEADGEHCSSLTNLLVAAADGSVEALWDDRRGQAILASRELARRVVCKSPRAQPFVQGPADLVALARRRISPDDFSGWGFALDEDLRVLRTYPVAALESSSLQETLRSWLKPGLVSEARYLAFTFSVPEGGLVPAPPQTQRLLTLGKHAALLGMTLLDCIRWNEMGFHACSVAGDLPRASPSREPEKIPIAAKVTTGNKTRL